MKVTFMTNNTSHNSSHTGRTGATAPTQNLACNKNPNSKCYRNTTHKHSNKENLTHTQPIKPVVPVGRNQRSNEFEDNIT